MKTKLYSLPGLYTICLPLLLLLLGTNTASGQTYSIFPSSAEPSLQNENDGESIETGVRFRVTQNGMINAIRFYRSPSDIGAHHATLWTNTGDTLSSSGTVNLEPGGGWKVIELPEPVAVGPGKLYVASVYNESGFYVSTPFAYSVSDIGSGPVYGVAFDSSAKNGVYHQGGAGFPNTSYHASNYFVDVIFTPAAQLPIVLTQLNSVDTEFNANLDWQTESEDGIEGFEIQRSSNGWYYNTLTFVPATGGPGTVSTYSYTDANLNPGTYQYRLKIRGANGQFQYSTVSECTIDKGPGLIVFKNYPNPVSTNTTIHYLVPDQTKIRLAVFDMNGRMVRVVDEGVRDAGHHYASFDAGPLNRGVYIISLQGEGYDHATFRMLVN